MIRLDLAITASRRPWFDLHIGTNWRTLLAVNLHPKVAHVSVWSRPGAPAGFSLTWPGSKA